MGAGYGLELAVLQFFASVRMPALTSFFTDVTTLGSLTFTVILVLALHVSGHRRPAILTGVATAISGSITGALKLYISRPRPELAEQLTHITIDPHAFPSGHTTVAFATATVLAGHVENRTARMFFAVMAVLVGISRIYLGVHYVTDVVVGALIGLFVGIQVLQYREGVLAKFGIM